MECPKSFALASMLNSSRDLGCNEASSVPRDAHHRRAGSNVCLARIFKWLAETPCRSDILMRPRTSVGGGLQMNAVPNQSAISRESLIHALYEAAELEHNLMCTYLYAAFSLKQGTEEGLSAAEADATARWRRAILRVAVEEMGHLTAVWNITSALGGSPRFGRLNFPLDPGGLPADVIVRLAPFNEAVLQHFIFLERPTCSDEPDGQGFDLPEFQFKRGVDRPRITPMPVDYNTVGNFYEKL